MYIDVHCHLTGDEFNEAGGVDAVLARAKENGVETVICSGFDLDSSYTAAALAEKYERVYFCAGFHPSELKKYKEGDLEKLEALCSHEKCVAVGEIGLDYHFDDNPPKETQRELFVKQLVLADKIGLPVVLHSRDAQAPGFEFIYQLFHQSGLRGDGICGNYLGTRKQYTISSRFVSRKKRFAHFVSPSLTIVMHFLGHSWAQIPQPLQ